MASVQMTGHLVIDTIDRAACLRPMPHVAETSLTLLSGERLWCLASANFILRHIPFVQTNFVLDPDSDKGKEPFALSRKWH